MVTLDVPANRQGGERQKGHHMRSHDAVDTDNWRRGPRLLAAAAGLCGLIIATSALSADWGATLDYQRRGSHREGLQRDPRTGDALRLISAVADVLPRETYRDWPSTLRVRFYLPEGQQQPDLRIRQITSPLGYYALDSVERQAWKANAVNDFQWSASVMASVYDLQYPQSASAVSREDWLAQLGVIVHLEPPRAGQTETVAPATLYHSSAPLDTAAYAFSFRTNAAATVKAVVLGAADRQVYTRPPLRVDAGSPYTLRWAPPAAEGEGWHSVVVDAAFESGRTQQQVVRFYHRRSLK